MLKKYLIWGFVIGTAIVPLAWLLSGSIVGLFIIGLSGLALMILGAFSDIFISDCFVVCFPSFLGTIIISLLLGFIGMFIGLTIARIKNV